MTTGRDQPESAATEPSAPSCSSVFLQDRPARSRSRPSLPRWLEIWTSRPPWPGSYGRLRGSSRRDCARARSPRYPSRPWATAARRLDPARGRLARERRRAGHRAARRGTGPGRRRHRHSHDGGHARCGRVGAARAAGRHALVGADRPAGSVDRRHAAHRRRRRPELALRLAVFPLAAALLAAANVVARRSGAPPAQTAPAPMRAALARLRTPVAGWHRKLWLTRPGRERSSTRARSSSRPTERPRP